MPRKAKPPITFLEAMQKLHAAGLDRSLPPSAPGDDVDQLASLEDRIKAIFKFVDSKKSTDMLFFVMYDIESNRVRRLVVKYLEQKGLQRVQKSIFLGNLPTAVYNEIRNDLAEVQACYDNHDSILIVPISTDYLKAMRIIGQSIDVDVITKSKNTLFF